MTDAITQALALAALLARSAAAGASQRSVAAAVWDGDALFTYYTAGSAVGMGKPRLRVFAALAAGYFCIAAALPGKGQLLYLLSALWALLSL